MTAHIYRLGLLAITIACVPACKETTCGGSINCGALDAAKCPTVAGCNWAPACLLSTKMPACATATSAAACQEPMCVWMNSSCISACDTVSAEDACKLTHSPDRDQSGNFVWECYWANCQGKAQKKCGDFSVAMCPADLGCKVETSSPWPDT